MKRFHTSSLLVLRRVLVALLLLVASLTTACKGETSAATMDPSKPLPGEFVKPGEEPPGVTPGSPGAPRPGIHSAPHGELPPPDLAIPGRATHRLSVDQLRRAIPQLLGVQWASNNGDSYFDTYSLSLGEADYLNINEDIREPSPLFAKTMDDMAGQVCRDATLQDASAEESARNVVRYPEDVDQNLRWLKLKFHGLYVPSGCDEGIAPLRELYERAEVICSTPSTEGCPGTWAAPYRELSPGWLAVCAALITDPEFMAY